MSNLRECAARTVSFVNRCPPRYKHHALCAAVDLSQKGLLVRLAVYECGVAHLGVAAYLTWTV
jgi:hypothetical protein